MRIPRILVTGSTGQVGRCLADRKDTLDAEWVFVSRDELDLSDPEAISTYLRSSSFDYCINAGAYTAVDNAETERDLAWQINAVAPRVLGQVCAETDCIVFHFSSDYVYDNGLERPLQEEDPTHPRSVYATSKLAGERELLITQPHSLIFRTSWVFSEYGHNFVRTMHRLMHAGKPLNIVDDQVGCPTYAGDLAEVVVMTLKQVHADRDKARFGVFNFCNAGALSWFDFAVEIDAILGTHGTIRRTTTAGYGAPAPRPAYSVLDTTKLQRTYGIHPQSWRSGLNHVLRILG